MASTLVSAPTATTFDVEELAKEAWAGSIRVPHFQRGFRWGWEDVRRLFDSIVKGYPVGSLLLWRRAAPATTLHLGALSIEAQASPRAYWVVDGQQRLTSLANALSEEGAADQRFAISYDLRREMLVRPSPTFTAHIVPLPVLFDLQKLLKWFSDNLGMAEYLDRATEVTKSLRQYEVPAYLVEADDPEVLQDIFDRMNNFGKRLTRAEIFTALNSRDEQYKEGDLTLEGIAGNLDTDFSFGRIDNDTILAAVLARRGPEVRRDIRAEFENSNDEGLNAAYKAGESAMRLAVRFLQSDAGVPHYTFLAYRYLFVVLTRVFALHPEMDARNLQLLRRWYWQAAGVGPEKFKGGTPNAARILCGKVTEGDLSGSIQRLLDAVSSRDPQIPTTSRFTTKDASTKILLCALWSKGPRDPLTCEVYTQDDLAKSLVDATTAQPAAPHIVPSQVVPAQLRSLAGNRALMPGLSVDQAELSSLVSAQPLTLSDDEFKAMCESHLIDEGLAKTLERGAFRDFVLGRQDRVVAELERFLEGLSEWRFENTPPLSSFDLDSEQDDDE